MVAVVGDVQVTRPIYRHPKRTVEPRERQLDLRGRTARKLEYPIGIGAGYVDAPRSIHCHSSRIVKTGERQFSLGTCPAGQLHDPRVSLVSAAHTARPGTRHPGGAVESDER